MMPMSATKTCCFFYPTTVVIVDDNYAFLENLPDNLEDSINYQLYTSPQKALDDLKSIDNHMQSVDDFLEVTDDLVTGESIGVNIAKIKQLAEDNKRHQIPSVIIVDHDMPEMSGIALCQKLSSFNFKKIMLTGSGEQNLAIDAFNEGIIDKFISKSDPEVFEKINQAVREMQQNYFADMSAPLISSIAASTATFLKHERFLDFFEKLIAKNNITEFYLQDAMGSFLLKGNKGQYSWLLVQSEQEIDNYLSVAKDHDASSEIIDAIANKQKLLCLLTEDDFSQPVSNWNRYLYDMHLIDDAPGYYYAYIEKEAVVETV